MTKQMANELLQTIGITINGNQPWDIQVYNENLYPRVLQYGALGLGESYMDHWWDCAQLDEFFARIASVNLEKKIKNNKRLLWNLFITQFLNFFNRKHALELGKKHYDLGNALFEKMLDPRMVYTCAYWKDATELEEAQLAKLELACQKLQLKPGMRLLDIGCGWGALAKYAAEKYGVHVVGVTISKEQCEYAKRLCTGLPIEIRFQDYRDIQGTFDRIVSLGMFEHVGFLNYHLYMNIVHRSLVANGLFLLHTIGSNATYFKTNAWTAKYIFSSGMLPSIAQIGKAVENLFVMEDWHNFGADYDKTLMAWHANFNKNWDHLKNHYDDRFFRMWNYYLLSSAGGFRSRQIQLWQIVFSKNGIRNGYLSVR